MQETKNGFGTAVRHDGIIRDRSKHGESPQANMRDAEHFKKSYKAGETPWDIGKPDDNLIHTVTSTPIAPCSALEIGCGTGDNAIWLSQEGFEVSGIDASEIAVEKAKEKAAKANVSCGFLVLDILRSQVEGAPF